MIAYLPGAQMQEVVGFGFLFLILVCFLCALVLLIALGGRSSDDE